MPASSRDTVIVQINNGRCEVHTRNGTPLDCLIIDKDCEGQSDLDGYVPAVNALVQLHPIPVTPSLQLADYYRRLAEG